MGLWRWLEQWFPPEQAAQAPGPPNGSSPGPREKERQRPLEASLAQTRLRLETAFAHCSDVVFREVVLPNGATMLLLYIEGMINAARVEQDVIVTLLHRWAGLRPTNLDDLHGTLISQVLPSMQVAQLKTEGEVLAHVLAGELALIVGGVRGAIALAYPEWEHRKPTEPTTEPTIRGPQEGFTENLTTNLAMLRRRVRTAALKFERRAVGEVSSTPVVVSYIEGIAAPDLVTEVRSRLDSIRIDGVLESGYLEEFLEDEPYSPFSQVQNSERPDVVLAALLEGRVAVLTEGTPYTLIMPATFFQLMQASEDYYERFLIGSALRLLRYALLFIALVMPSLYVAITTFHPEMIPTNLLVTIASAREGVPFPAIVEAILMELTLEALREAGIRLPRQVGQAVSIVGALVIGQAAVQAGIVSAPVVIVVSFTGIASFVAPRYNAIISFRLLRFPLMLLGGSLGLFGVIAGLLAIVIHLCSLRSFGVPYMSPLTPLSVSGLQDVAYRAPHWLMRLRPRTTGRTNRQRVPPGQKPRPPQSGGG